MRKELNINEAMKMPTETLFEVYYENGDKDARSAKVLEVFDGKCKKRLVWDNRADINVIVTESILNATFIPIPQPVSFMKALASDKKCNVKSEIISKVYSKCSRSSYIQVDIIKNILDGKFDYINSIIYALSGYMESSDWEELIKNGKFYLESECE